VLRQAPMAVTAAQRLAIVTMSVDVGVLEAEPLPVLPMPAGPSTIDSAPRSSHRAARMVELCSHQPV
jgi:hypothetical protein